MIQHSLNSFILFERTAMALYQAARDGDVAEVRRLIASGADSNGAEETTFGRMALHRAAFNGHVDCVRVLVEGGASVDKRDRFGLTPLHWAASRKHCEIVTYLLEKGASVNSMNSIGQTPLHFAGNAAVAKELLRWGADPNMRDNDGETPIDVARTSREREDVVRVLENPSAWMGAGATAPVNEGESDMVIALKYFIANIFQIIRATYCKFNLCCTTGQCFLRIREAEGSGVGPHSFRAGRQGTNRTGRAAGVRGYRMAKKDILYSHLGKHKVFCQNLSKNF